MHSAQRLSGSGVTLHVHRWSPNDEEIRAELLLLHGYAEHAERYREFALNLASFGIATTVPDLRGHGRSDGARGYVEDYDDYVQDAKSTFETLDEAQPRFVLGHSNGGLVAFDYLDRYEPPLRGLIVTNPYLELAMVIPPWKRALGRLAARLYPRLRVPSGIAPEVVSRDTEIVSRYERDPLVFQTVTAGFAREHERTAGRVQTLEHVDTALLYIHSDNDPLVSVEANRRLSARLQSPDKLVWVRQNELHEVLNELDRDQLHRSIAQWMVERSST